LLLHPVDVNNFFSHLKPFFMARVRNNATDRMSGKVDQFVYRNRNGKTVAARKPDRSRVPASEAQEAVRTKFRMATRYAKSVMSDPQKLALYAEKVTEGRSVHNLAVADFFDAPGITEINAFSYAGNINDKIAIRVDDKCPVAMVHVKIVRGDGSVVEQGLAVTTTSSVHWEYSCTAANTAAIGSTVIITAIDLPGNMTEKQKTI
jgi:hypothetical protein